MNALCPEFLTDSEMADLLEREVQLAAADEISGPDATARDTKNGARAGAGRREDVAMLHVPHSDSGGHHGAAQVQVGQYDMSAECRRGLAFIERRIAESRALPAGKMVSETIILSPALAAEVLKRFNRGNRPLRQSRAEEFARTIKEGRWKLSSQGISFSPEGELNNGQHRLNGVIKAGQSVEIYVTFGEERDVFDILDTGAVRGGSDALSISGYKNTSCLAASAKFLMLVEQNRIFNPPRINNDEILGIVGRHPRLQDATVPGHGIGQKLRCSSAATTVAFYRIMALSRQAERLDDFVRLLREGTLPDTRDPILVLRDGLLTKKLDAHVRLSSVKTFAQYAAIINAWNKHLRNRRGSLRWEHPDPLPKPE